MNPIKRNKEADPITYYDDPFPAKIPINYHIGCMGLPPASHDFVDSIPPMVTGGNLDNKRIGEFCHMEGFLILMRKLFTWLY